MYLYTLVPLTHRSPRAHPTLPSMQYLHTSPRENGQGMPCPMIHSRVPLVRSTGVIHSTRVATHGRTLSILCKDVGNLRSKRKLVGIERIPWSPDIIQVPHTFRRRQEHSTAGPRVHSRRFHRLAPRGTEHRCIPRANLCHNTAVQRLGTLNATVLYNGTAVQRLGTLNCAPCCTPSHSLLRTLLHTWPQCNV